MGSDRERAFSLEEQKLTHRGEQILSSQRRRITNLCIEAKNSFYAAMTLSENYQNITQGIRVGAIDGFLTFLEEMRPLAKDDGLGDVLWEETRDVFTDLLPLLPWDGGRNFVPDGITERLLIKCRSYVLLSAERMGRQLAKRAQELCSSEVDEEEMGNFCLQMEREFRNVLQAADVYRCAFLLVQRDATKGDNSSVDPLCKLRPLALVEEDGFILHQSALLMVLQALMELKELSGAGAWAFMVHSKALRDELLAMVNWQFEEAEALLHSLRDYSLLREKLGIMEFFSLRAYIYHLESLYHCGFLGTVVPCQELSVADDRTNPDYSRSWNVLSSLSRDVCDAYERYRTLNVPNLEFQKTLVDFFYGYMELLLCFGLRDNKGLDYIKSIPKLWACRTHSHALARELHSLHGDNALPAAMENKWDRVEKQENLSLRSNRVEGKPSSQEFNGI